jgi:hypothetical protein
MVDPTTESVPFSHTHFFVCARRAFMNSMNAKYNMQHSQCDYAIKVTCGVKKRSRNAFAKTNKLTKR